jgi:outer membrane receptor protein involved in Fe transport
MEYKEVPTDCSSGTCVPASDKLPGDPPDLAVQLSWSLFLDYHHALNASSTLYGRADFQHSDEAQVTIRNPLFNSISLLPARDLLNLRIGTSFGRYDLSLYANNALDEKNPVVVGPFGVITEDVSSMPRQYGLTLQVKF